MIKQFARFNLPFLVKRLTYSKFLNLSTCNSEDITLLSKPSTVTENTIIYTPTNKVKNVFCKKPLTGRVEFDFGEVAHPQFGTVHVKGQYPRIGARYQRYNLLTPEVDATKLYLSNWIDKHVESRSEDKYFGGMEEVIARCVPALYPFPAIETTEMKIALKAVYWTWILDNVLEHAITSVPSEVLEKATTGLLRLLRNDSEIYEDVPEYPLYSFLFHTLQDILQDFRAHCPGYQNKMEQFQFSIERYFNAMLRYAVSPIDKSYPEESFRNYRTVLEYYDTTVSIIWILESRKTDLPDRIKNCSTIRLLLDRVNAIAGFTNDLLGWKKDFEKGETDNLVVFKVVEKKIQLENAIEQMCVLISHEIDDFLILRDGILRKFDFHPELVKYLDILEAVIDGNTRFFAVSVRHKSAGFVKLID